MTKGCCSWTGFYQEFADRLLAFKDNRAELIDKVVAAYKSIGLPLPRLDDSPIPFDIDPYTVFGLFNKGISDANRRKIVASFAEVFGVKAPQPSDYDGIPLLNNLNATFYAFSNDKRRGDYDIDNLWSVFEFALVLADEENAGNRDSFIEAYDKTANQFGLGYKLTVGLFWSRPYMFINLDSRNRWYLGDRAEAGLAVSEVMPKEKDSANVIRNGEKYLSICDAVKSALNSDVCSYFDFPSLSNAAYVESLRANEQRKAAEKAAEELEGDELHDVSVLDVKSPVYGREAFLSEVYMDKDAYDALVDVLRAKKNVILQGAPGVGKTFIAKRLAYSLVGAKDSGQVMMVQFHQSYSYEDFIEGFRPCAEGFRLEKGSFYSFCKRAAEDADNDYFFIIDEINRGNLSRIFGELFMLIERDKRGSQNKLQLLYSREPFYVPENVYLIGTMNTADRSLAMLDFALRRRFAFFDLRPGFESEGFISYRNRLDSRKFNEVISCVGKLNEAIAADDTLGEGFCVGHSYFCGMKPDDAAGAGLLAVVEYELVPLLREYWFDEPSKVEEWASRLRRAVM